MSTKSQKRALPPTPTSTKYTNVSDAIQSLLDTSDEGLSDRERRWYNDLSNCQKSIEQKDVRNLCILIIISFTYLYSITITISLLYKT